MRKRNRKFIDKWKLRDWRNVVKLRDRWNKTNVQYGSLVYPYDESGQMITKNKY
ncbi:MAG: hypothetical protein WAZ77_08165 [Candidatus Nitrosopolaris sp.]